MSGKKGRERKSWGVKKVTWIVCHEPQHEKALGIQDHRVPPHGHRGEVGLGDVGVGVEAGVLVGAVDDLEVVAVQMERVLARVVVVDDNLDDLALVQDEGARVGPVDVNGGGEAARAQDGVEGGDLGGFVRYVVEEGAASQRFSVSNVCITEKGRETGD